MRVGGIPPHPLILFLFLCPLLSSRSTLSTVDVVEIVDSVDDFTCQSGWDLENGGMKSDPEIHHLKLGWKVPKGYRRREILFGPVRMEVEVKGGGLLIKQWRGGVHGGQPSNLEVNLALDWSMAVITSIREELGV